MAEWYYLQGGSQQGPASEEQLRGMIASGQLSPNDSVWRNGMANWAPISAVPELMPASSASPEPARSAPPMSAPQADYQDDYEPAPRSRSFDGMTVGGMKLISIWSIILLSGGGLWFLNAFMPWISGIGYTRGWGLAVPAGIVAFIMSILIFGSIIPSFFVPIMAEWRWTAGFFFGFMGLILLILGLVAFSYSNSVGPFFHLLGTLAVMGGGITEGVFGLLRFLRKTKRQPQ